MGSGDIHSEDLYITRRGSGRVIVGIDVVAEDDSKRPFTRIRNLRL